MVFLEKLLVLSLVSGRAGYSGHFRTHLTPVSSQSGIQAGGLSLGPEWSHQYHWKPLTSLLYARLTVYQSNWWESDSWPYLESGPSQSPGVFPLLFWATVWCTLGRGSLVLVTGTQDYRLRGQQLVAEATCDFCRKSHDPAGKLWPWGAL